jgi:molybdopterin converting factor small subunit
LFVQFHGIWGLYLGAERKPLDGCSLDEALALMEGKFGPLLRQKLKERGVRLDGDITKHSYIALNDKGIQQLAGRQLKESDVLHVFPAVTGG